MDGFQLVDGFCGYWDTVNVQLVYQFYYIMDFADVKPQKLKKVFIGIGN